MAFINVLKNLKCFIQTSIKFMFRKQDTSSQMFAMVQENELDFLLRLQKVEPGARNGSSRKADNKMDLS